MTSRRKPVSLEWLNSKTMEWGGLQGGIKLSALRHSGSPTGPLSLAQAHTPDTVFRLGAPGTLAPSLGRTLSLWHTFTGTLSRAPSLARTLTQAYTLAREHARRSLLPHTNYGDRGHLRTIALILGLDYSQVPLFSNSTQPISVAIRFQR